MMQNEPLRIYIARTNLIPFSFTYDLGDDTYTSEIHTGADVDTPLIATFTVTKTANNRLVLGIDDSVSAGITKTYGYMDIKRVSGGEPLPVFDHPLQVVFVRPVTG